MNQVKIRKFIAECRKNNNLTQMQLAEKLNITDRAISKWENGKAMPDSSIMLKLCDELKITVNELLNGEVIKMKEYDKKAEEKLLEMVKEKEIRDKELLAFETFIMITLTTILLVCVFIALSANISNELRTVLIILGVVPFIVGIGFAIRIEQIAGYYECSKCHHRYIPTYKRVLFAMHINRTRKMKCPKCGEKSWNKKVLNK